MRSPPRSLGVGAAALAALIIAGACLRPLPLDGQGYRCEQDADCGGLRCMAGLCGEPITAALYFADYPERWARGSTFAPSLAPDGGYSQDDPGVVAAQRAAMEYGKIRVGFVSWSGPGSPEDARLTRWVSVPDAPLFAVYDKVDFDADPSAEVIALRLDYIATHLASAPGYARIGDRFLVVVQSDVDPPSVDDCSIIRRWRDGVAQMTTAARPYLLMRQFTSSGVCSEQPDGWFSRTDASISLVGVDSSYSVAAGYWTPGSTPANCRDLTSWYGAVREMRASGAPLRVITSFNDWFQGSAIESATAWETSSGFGAFLDALHVDGAGEVPAMTFPDCP